MSLAQDKSDLKKHLSRHIHIEKDGNSLGPASLSDVVDSSKDQVDAAVAPQPALKPLV
jgi:hypothetical protein